MSLGVHILYHNIPPNPTPTLNPKPLSVLASAKASNLSESHPQGYFHNSETEQIAPKEGCPTPELLDTCTTTASSMGVSNPESEGVSLIRLF